MTKFEIFESTPEKTAYIDQLKKTMPSENQLISWINGFSEPDFTDEFPFRGHHIHNPLLRFIHAYPEILPYFQINVEKPQNPNISSALAKGTLQFIDGLLETKLSLAYLADLFGYTQAEQIQFIQKIAWVHWSFIQQPSDTTVILTVDDKDVICNSCNCGEHCTTVKDQFSRTIDAIWISECIRFADDAATVLSKEKMFDGKTYPVKAILPLDKFRSAIFNLYPRKLHLLPQKKTDN